MRRITLCLLLATSLGLHWGLLQSVAWTGMLIDHLGVRSLDEAVSMTFDGAHPCELCLAIDEARATATDDERSPLPDQRLEAAKAVMGQPSPVLVGPTVAELVPAWPPARRTRPWDDGPEPPPPRRG